MEFKLPWLEAASPNHQDDKVDSDQKVVDKEISPCCHQHTPFIADVASSDWCTFSPEAADRDKCVEVATAKEVAECCGNASGLRGHAGRRR